MIWLWIAVKKYSGMDIRKSSLKIGVNDIIKLIISYQTSLKWTCILCNIFYVICSCIHDYLTSTIFKFLLPFFYPSFTHPCFCKFYNPFRFLAFSTKFPVACFHSLCPTTSFILSHSDFFFVFLGGGLTDWFSHPKQDKRAHRYNIKTLWCANRVASERTGSGGWHRV